MVPYHLNIGPIVKPMAPSGPAGKIAMNMSYFQSRNYNILQNKVVKQEKSIYFKILGYEEFFKIQALKSKFKPKMDR